MKKIKEGWEEVHLGDITHIIKRGVSPKYVEEDGIMVVNQRCIRDNKVNLSESRLTSKEKKIPEDRLLQKGDVLINSTGTGTLGRTAYYQGHEEKVTVDTHVTIVRGKEDIIDPRFLGFNLNFNEPVIENLGKGATNQIELSAKDLKITKVIIPKSLPTQRKIASVLSTYDDLIENNLKRIQILEEMAQQTYEEWFVRMKYPGHEEDEMDEKTGLPVGWEKVKMVDLCNSTGGGTPSKNKPEFWDKGTINWFTPTDLSKSNTIVNTDSIIKTNQLGIDKSSAKLLNPNSFAMTSRATIGLFSLFDKPFSTNQGFINVTPKHKKYKGYLFYNLKFRIEELKGFATGTTFLELSQSNFRRLSIIKPSDLIVEKFNDLTENIFNELFILTYQNQHLLESRDILLPRLMMGLVDVEEILD